MTQERVVIGVALGCILLGGLLWIGWRIRRRYRSGRQALQDLKFQARSMQLETQGMAESAATTSTRKKS